MLQDSRLYRIMTLLALALLILAPLAAEAGGEVKGVSATPSPATKGTPVTITVTGKDDPCQSLDLDFGDGTPHATYSGPLDPPKTFLHTYTTTGNKTITAKGVNKCKGEASASLTVKSSSLVQLCTTINCGAIFSVTPKIDQVVPFISNITPGGGVAIKGSGFGTTEGKLYLKGLKKYNGVDLGLVEIPIAKEQGKDFWNPTNVLGFIPGSITQVKDQPAKLQIKTSANQWSNEFPVNFTATKDYVLLPHTDPAVKVVSCGTDSNYDKCNQVNPQNEDQVFWTYGTGCFDTLCGVHENCWGCVGDDVGVDQYQILSLKNGWLLEALSVWHHKSSGDEVISGPAPAFPSGATSWSPSMSWKVSPNDRAAYGVSVFIKGPKGVPH